MDEILTMLPDVTRCITSSCCLIKQALRVLSKPAVTTDRHSSVSALQITQNSLPRCTGSSSAYSISPISTKSSSALTFIPSDSSILRLLTTRSARYETHKSDKYSSIAQCYDGLLTLSGLTSQKIHRGGLGLGGLVHEEAHPCFPYFVQE